MNSKDEWLELSASVQGDAAAAQLEELLTKLGAVAVYLMAGDDSEIFEPPVGQTPLWQRTAVTGLFTIDCNRSEIMTILRQHLGSECLINARCFANSEWTRVWLEHFHPIEFDNNFWVAATEHHIDARDACVLRLDPGLAFGTGNHPTTALCIQYLVAQNLAACTVYDYGCGSGILGIAAALLGAKEVYQTDIDPQALTASAYNAAKNGVTARVHLCRDPQDAPKVDLLIANILLLPLCELKDIFKNHLKDGATMIFSGILDHQFERLQNAYHDDFTIKIINKSESWLLIELQQIKRK